MITMDCRVLKSKKCTITQGCKSSHVALDLVKEGYMLDDITSHSDGKVVQVISNCNINTSGDSRYNSPYRDANNPGNMVKIDHGNGYYTRYLHLAYNTVKVKVGDTVKAGQVLGYMGNTGYSFGGHLHFEIWEGSKKIDPTPYINKELPTATPTVTPTATLKHNRGETVTINGVYYTSTSTEKLNPLKTTGTITDVIEGARNPYLLDGGNIGWANDDCIVTTPTVRYLSNPNYKGGSIVDGLNQIGVNSSYNYRSKLAKANGINNYSGTAEQNTKLLNLLKQGKLIAA